MRQHNGVFYVAYGNQTQRETEQSIATLREYHKDLPVVIHKNKYENLSDAQSARWAKINLDLLSPFENSLYLDADTRIRGDLSAGFEILEDGYDLVMSFSDHQDGDCLWHVDKKEQDYTIEQIGYLPLQLQCGVMFMRKSPEINRLFEQWRSEWRYFCDQDQAAFLRALHQAPIRLWMLGRPWNGGAVINHLYGRCRS